MLYRCKIPTIDQPQLGKWSQTSTQSALVGTAGNKLVFVPKYSIPAIGQIIPI